MTQIVTIEKCSNYIVRTVQERLEGLCILSYRDSVPDSVSQYRQQNLRSVIYENVCRRKLTML